MRARFVVLGLSFIAALGVAGGAVAGDQPAPTKDEIINALTGAGDPAATRAFRPIAAAKGASPAVQASYTPGGKDAAPVGHPSIGVPILFDLNSAAIKPESTSALDAVSAALQSDKLRSAKIELEGHTDASGAAESNLALSEARAKAVRDYLVAKGGVDAKRLSTVGKGQTEPALPDQPLAAENRRVVLVNLGAN